jgi:hypothetical protein
MVRYDGERKTSGMRVDKEKVRKVRTVRMIV